MKKQITCLLVFLSIVSNAFSQNIEKYQVLINLNLSDCNNCILPIKQFSQIKKQLNPKIVLKSSDKRIAKAYLQKQGIIDIEDKDFLYSDSLFQALAIYASQKMPDNISKSNVFILWNKSIIKVYPLISFDVLMLAGLENVSIERKKILPDSILLGNVISVEQYLSNVAIYDEMFKVAYLVQNNKTIKISGDNFNKNLLYEKIFGSLKNIDKDLLQHKQVLETLGKQYVEITKITISEQGTVLLYLTFYIVQEKDTDLAIIPCNIIAETDWQGNILNYIVSKKLSIDDDYTSMLPAFSLSMEKSGKAHVTLSCQNPDTLKAFIGEAQISKNAQNDKIIQFKKFSKLKFPKFAIETKTNYLFLNGKILSSYYFFTFENLVGNIETGEYFNLIKGLNSHKYSELVKNLQNLHQHLEYHLLSVLLLDKNQQIFSLLIKQKNETYIYTVNLLKREIVSTKKLFIPTPYQNEIIISNYNLINNNQIIGINAYNELVTFKF
jgi:hypothetical protein